MRLNDDLSLLVLIVSLFVNAVYNITYARVWERPEWREGGKTFEYDLCRYQVDL